MSPATKLALRRFALRWLRKIIDVADDRLHAAEVSLRNDLSGCKEVPIPVASCDRETANARTCLTSEAVRPGSETFIEWEARRSGVAPVSKKAVRKRRERAGAAAFDLRFAR
jgi:hypothetical protein